jgi:hypothetical protein
MIEINGKGNYEIIKEILKEMAKIPSGWREKVFYENDRIIFSSPFTGNVYIEGEKAEIISLYDFLAESEIAFIFDDGYFYTKMNKEECDWEHHLDMDINNETDRYYLSLNFDHKHSFEEGIEELLLYDSVYEFLEEFLENILSS